MVSGKGEWSVTRCREAQERGKTGYQSCCDRSPLLAKIETIIINRDIFKQSSCSVNMILSFFKPSRCENGHLPNDSVLRRLPTTKRHGNLVWDDI